MYNVSSLKAQRLKYKVEILEPSTPWKFDCEELARRNVHGVPFIKILKMLGRYERDITVESILASSLPATRQKYVQLTDYQASDKYTYMYTYI